MADETLSFSIIARDQASSAFRETARSASDLAGKMDIAARPGRVLDETLRKEVRAGDELSKSFAVSARATDLLKAEQRRLAEDAALASGELRLVKREADKLDGTTADVKVKVNVDRSALSRLRGIFGGGGSGGGGGLGGLLSTGGDAAGGAAKTGGGLFSGLPPEAQAGGIAAAITAALTLGPGVIGAGLGGAVGLGAIGGGLFGASEGTKILKADTANITQITTGLKTAIGKQKTQLSAALKDANKQYAKDSAFYAPFIGFQKSLQGLVQVVIKPLRPIMEPLTKIIAQFGKGLADLGPQFTALFKASLPFIQQFASVMLQSGKILLPAFTQALNEMVKSGALKLMTQGLVILVQGLARFIVALGPGMKASAQIFVDVSKTISLLLQAVGKTASWLANVFNDYFHMARERLKEWRTDWDGARHMIASVFDGIRHDIAATWNGLWNNTVTRAQNGVADVVGWFQKLPGRAVGALFGLGHQLYAFAHAALTEFLDGFKAVGGTVLSWVGNFAKNVWNKVKNFFGVHSPSSLFYDIGKNLMLGLFHGIKDHAWKAAHAAQQAAAGLQPFGGKFGPGVTQWAPDILKVLGMLGQSSSNLGAVEHRMMQESGGNPNAINLTDSNAAMGDPSRGLMQTIMTTFEAYRSWSLPNNIYNPMANIFAGLNYAINSPGYRGRSLSSVMLQPGGYAYGTSSAAPGWAWVGERGPELLHFRGGEQVYPAQAASGSGGSGQSALLAEIADTLASIEANTAAAPGRTGRALGDTLNGAVRSGAYASMYGSR